VLGYAGLRTVDSSLATLIAIVAWETEYKYLQMIVRISLLCYLLIILLLLLLLLLLLKISRSESTSNRRQAISGPSYTSTVNIGTP
jgi:hypothetical protein